MNFGMDWHDRRGDEPGFCGKWWINGGNFDGSGAILEGLGGRGV